MVIDKRIMFAMRAAKNIAKLPEAERSSVYAQMGNSQYEVVSKAVNLLLSRKEKAS